MDSALKRLRFEPGLEQDFIQDHGERSVSVVRTFFGIAFLIILLGNITQVFANRTEFQTLINVAFTAISPICGVIFGLTFFKGFGKISQPLLTLGTIIIAWSILYVWYTYPNGFSLYGSLVIVLLTPLIYSVTQLRFYWAVTSAWISVAIYMVYANRSGVFEGETIFQPIYVLLSNLFSMLAGYYVERAARRDFLLTRMLEEERNRTEAVLSNILPDRIAERLKNDDGIIADLHEDVVILFADIVDFTKFSSQRGPDEVVRALDVVFTGLDDLAERYDLEKIKTIGDAYMVVAGLSDPKPDDAERVIRFALEMDQALAHHPDAPFRMRIGIHCGPVVAGVIGKRRLVYDLWGDTVNTASRMESTGEAGLIQMSEDFVKRIEGHFPVVDRGVIKIKGKGAMRTYMLAAGPPETPTSPAPAQP